MKNNSEKCSECRAALNTEESKLYGICWHCDRRSVEFKQMEEAQEVTERALDRAVRQVAKNEKVKQLRSRL